MAVTTTKTNKPLNPRGNDQSPKGYNRASLFSGKALDFDGVNDVLSLDGYTTFTGDFSLSMYIKTSTIAQKGLLCDSANNDGLLLWTTDEELVIRIDGTNHDWDTGLPIYNDYMNHLVVVRSGSEVTPYLNGVAGNSVTATSGTFAFNQFGRQTTSANYFNGQAANIKAFNVALTAAQVADLYNNPEKIVPTGVADSALKLWLPMQEGAGTTAYDGSGNGNHGTISGATWTHGIGAPVSQTAVIDWNKGSNLTTYSEDGSQWNTGGNTPTITQDQADPFGGTRAQRIQMDTNGGLAQIYKTHNQINAGVEYTAKMWLKAVSGTPTIGINYNGSGGTWHQVTLTNEWAEYEVTRTMNANYSSSHNIIISSVHAPGTSSTADFYIYGLQIQLGDTAGPYVPTFGTAQSNEVLLPAGLTTGRDITGVNLFENVRKQGALNLDGNSWAEVHDNASLDITDEVTLECWLYHIDTTKLEHIIGKRASSGSWLRIYSASTNTLRVERDGGAATSNVSITENAWSHIVATIDTSNVVRFYINGTQQTSKLNFTPWGLDNAAPVSLGAWVTESGAVSSNSYENGQIAQPRIYNRALSAEEVERNYNAGKNIYK